ncbi:YPO3983 family protein [Rosenbergiella australiborealis]|uniref:YPO3983 family protein n=1 Tax=Rosenbergiella australiborealis TaxID=1544696 RepID=UPI001F4D932D|nr:YPO3983 family protein [Rosenbergiella australiborealis]
MPTLSFPLLIFKTRNRRDDYGARDMRYGDLTAAQLISQYRLNYVSDIVDPYTLTRRNSMNQPQSMFCCNLRGQSEKITRQHCSDLLFDEFRRLSRIFSFYGPYKQVIGKMITHMQYSDGKPFTDRLLDRALEEQILGDKSYDNSTRILITKAIESNINWEKLTYPIEMKNELSKAVSLGKLPKFDRLQDHYNGMGISVHDTWSTYITLKSLNIKHNRFRAEIHYNVQDHFGLDNDDIMNTRFSQFQFFRLWFVLQRYDQFGFKPFMTNMHATIEISGSI